MTGGTVTTAEAALAAGVTPTTIRNWVRRGHLRVEHRWRGRNVYRLQDVLDVEAQTHERDNTGRTDTRA